MNHYLTKIKKKKKKYNTFLLLKQVLNPTKKFYDFILLKQYNEFINLINK